MNTNTMKKRLLHYIWLIQLMLTSASCNTIFDAKEPEVFVKDGTSKNVIQSGGIWSNDDKTLNGSGVNNYLLAGKTIEAGDFELSARLSLDSLNYSGASLIFAGNQFGFDARSTNVVGESALFVEGPLFGKNTIIAGTENKIKAGEPFEASVKLRGKELTLFIDGLRVFTQQISANLIGNMALRPWRNKMNVIDFKASGKLGPVHKINYLFESGTDGYNAFRIPVAVLSAKGTIVAIAEGRKNSASDTGNIDLVMKRSEDNGETWSELKVIWNDSLNVCGNPAPVVDYTTGTIWLLSTWNLGADHESDIIKQTSKDTRRVFVINSTDDGVTWSEPFEITSSVKKSDWTWYATGPCHGIQVEKSSLKGRLVIPCDHIEAVSNKYYSHIIYSDDHGKSWNLGGSTPQDQVNECTVAELSDGSLMLNMRNYDRNQKVRKVAVSKDGGLSWGNIYPDTALIEPICQGSMLNLKTDLPKGSEILFLNPGSETSRCNMTLRLSKDDGKTWPYSKVLYAGASAYSDLVQLPQNKIGCLYEAGYITPYQGIVYQEVSLHELDK